jgi:UDP-glucuronate 4-epimerase
VFKQVDFSDHVALDAALECEDFDRVIHLGAQAGVRYSIENPRAYLQANLAGHLNMIEIGRHRQVEHLVYASSSSVYGGNDTLPFRVEDRVDQPLSLYAATKKADELMSETYAHLYRLPQTGLRFFTVHGPLGSPGHGYVALHKSNIRRSPDRRVRRGANAARLHLYRRHRRRRRRLSR